ncbi:FtsK/SpoIIIE domain-containing protein [Streptomyces sp. NPDC053069]|uniref:FtsK/SpoIIIE domain-containing protein n=1 Tax=Streptomyces sp. NPDC053069 TaxID=3365695 RepID=UPI0037D90323
MSTTPEPSDSDFTAALIADGLIAEAMRSGEHRRLYLAGHLGLGPETLFEALRERLHPDRGIIVDAPLGPVQLQGVPLGIYPGGEALLVPYLVGSPGPNAGSAGFAAFLRDEVPVGTAPRVLLILDEHPVETVRTAAEDAALLEALQWPQLLDAAISGAEPAVLTLLRTVIEDDARFGRMPRTFTSVGALRRLATRTDPIEAGAGLDLLGCYLSDPAAHTDARRRLRRGATWRAQLEAWSAPDQNIEARLLPRYPDQSDPGLKRVLAAQTPFGIDFAKITLADMPRERASVTRLRLVSPVRARGAACASLPGRAAIWKPGGGSFSIMLTSPATSEASVTLMWADGGAPVELHIAAGDREITIDTEGEGWRFARLELPTGEAADLAIFLGTGDWAPFESRLDLDLTSSAFRCTGEPQLLAMGKSGELLGQPEVEATEDFEGDGEPCRCVARFGQQSQPIDLLLDGSSGEFNDSDDDPGIDTLPPGPGPDTGEIPPEDEGNEGEEGPDSGGTAGSVPRFPSVAHARLSASRSGQAVGPSSFRVTADGVGRGLTPGVYELESQRLAQGLDGLKLERQILARPDATAFVVRRFGGDAVLDPHPHLDRLDLGGLPREFCDAFLHARVNLFAALATYGSVHALGAGVAHTEAEAYVAAYEALLDAMLARGRFLAEYERILLCDAISDPATGELFIAPTNPISVRYILMMTEEVEGWLPRASEVLPADLDSCSTRHLLPFFAMQGTWYETAEAAPLLWRRYRPQSQANPGEHRPGYIARRIEHFLRVHPEYRDERQVLSLAFHEPGDGGTVLAALRRLVRPLATESTPQPLPQLQVTIISSSSAPSALQGVVSGATASSRSDATLDRILRDRVSLQRAAPDDGIPEFAHLSFVFQSSLDREPAAVDLTSRAGTLYAGGLAAAPGRHTEPGRNETAFSWGTFVGTGLQSPLQALVRKTLELVGGMPREHFAPGRTRMPSTRVASAFLGDLYQSSAWVVHLDKLLGLEAFAPDATGRQARYLIDYEDRADPTQPGLDAITATARVAPYRLALRQALKGLGRPSEAALDRLLQLFNGVSGRWALDLVGANPNDLHERIGLATALASLQDLDGGLHADGYAGIVIPIEEMLDALPRAARPASGHLCDDLLYLRIPLGEARPRLRGRLLEVKYRGSTDSGAAHTAREQLQRAHSWLTSTFGTDPGSPQRRFRARDLAELIRGSATRASAFGLLSAGDRNAAEAAIDAVSRGDFTLELGFEVGGQPVYGDFVSIEADNVVPAHRQPLPGAGLPLGHLRLGRPALEALAMGRQLPRPSTLPVVTYPEPPNPPPSDSGSPHTSPDSQGGSARDSGSSEATSPHTSPELEAVSARDSSGLEPATPSQPAEVLVVAGRLDSAFAKYGLGVEPFSSDLAQVGPSVIRFRTRTLGKLSISDVERRSRDIGREIAAPGEVQIGDEPGFVTVDVPRSERGVLLLADVLPSLDATPGKPGALQFVAGVAPSGQACVADLSRLPHLLVAGATGSGKSVFLRGLLVELLRARTPEQLQLVIIDPKRLDFAAFTKVPHLRGGTIISDPDEALERLRRTLEAELSQRQPILEDAGVTSAAEYYEMGGPLEDLPQLVIVVDEFADLVLGGSDRKGFSELIQRYAQLTRAYGIYLVLATQRPSVDVVTGSIKANLSARIAFSLPSGRDSMTVLDRVGAEDLLGDGDLLFYRNGRIERLQAPLTTLHDVRKLMP